MGRPGVQNAVTRFVWGGQVEVQGVEGPLKAEAEAAMTIRPNFAYTLKEVQDNIQRIFDIGAFQETSIEATDTRDGVKVVFKVGRFYLFRLTDVFNMGEIPGLLPLHVIRV
jgi:hypothetical protein